MVKLKPLPPELYKLAMDSGSKPQSIRRYKETFTMCGAVAARLQIEQEDWFRARWRMRDRLCPELNRAMKAIPK